MKVVFRSGGTLCSMLIKVKDSLQLGKQSRVVHHIGKLIRRLETRLKEHWDACKRGMVEKSAVVEHAWKE